MFNRHSRKLIVSALVIALLVGLYVTNKEQPLYGNDHDSIAQVIQSIEGYQGIIEIIHIEDIADERYVAFLTNNIPAYIQFEKDKDGNYLWRHIEKREDSFASFIIPTWIEKPPKLLIVANLDNDIAAIEVQVNEHVMKRDIPVNQLFATVIDLPKADGGSYKFEYNYFDQNGDPIRKE
ncbi:hypothetical protein BEP19_08125 [Ammoniphilus oxalaticus]|uniref:Uncharacterized protein n=1 Tax=Ammoniphilus oxalaticus TaxID=66863 RepID=A0A419SJY6_9BACL|nr:hypothetical protein [Ammoniphilus oxalaticus]RKD24351.1 hypothetical protein BEP19_08125 [Ammoniphilus oxalaticus]